MGGKSKLTYEQAFHSFRISDLKDLCRLLGIKGASGLRKNEIIHKVVTKLINKNTFEQICFYATKQEIQFFKRLIANPIIEEEDCEALYYWFARGYFFIEQNGQAMIFDEVKQLMNSLSVEFWLKYDRFHAVCDHVKAAVHLYGVIPVEDFLSIFNGWEKVALTRYELLDVCQRLEKRPELVDFEIYDDLLFDEVLFDDDNGYFAYEAVYARQGEGPYYRPSQKNFLRYADPDYFEFNQTYKAFSNYLVQTFHVHKEIAKDICEDIARYIHLGYQEHDILQDLENKGIPSDKFHKADLRELLVDIINQSRNMLLKGYTPIEANVPILIEGKRSNRNKRTRKNVQNSTHNKLVVFPTNH